MQGGKVTSFGPGVDAALKTIDEALESDLNAGLEPFMDPRTWQHPSKKYASMKPNR
jgi:hypothetical protein